MIEKSTFLFEQRVRKSRAKQKLKTEKVEKDIPIVKAKNSELEHEIAQKTCTARDLQDQIRQKINNGLLQPSEDVLFYLNKKY